VWAGAQVEEPLADSVRSALSAAINDGAPPKPVFDTIELRLTYLRWLGEMSQRLRKRFADNNGRGRIPAGPLVREQTRGSRPCADARSWYRSKADFGATRSAWSAHAATRR
jgi:hypothetical protein